MKNVLRWMAAAGSVLALATGCSDDEQPEAAPAQPAFSVFAAEGAEADPDSALRTVGEDIDPVVESLTLVPAVPETRARMRAVAKVTGRHTSIDYEWKLNGQPFGGSALEVVLPVIETGDTVEVRAIPIRGRVRGEGMTASVQARNQKPMILGLGVEYADDGDRHRLDGEVWKAVATAEDPDGDSVEISYRWYVNGQLADGEDEYFSATGLTRGDRVSVEVQAFDGRAWSGTTRSGAVQVGNAPPEIVSVPPRVDARGQFRYQIEVEDPDGDRGFRYSLRRSPRGMQIDEINGIVRWSPDTDQVGRHPVEVVVADEGGAESTQSFSLALVSQSEDGPGPAAAR